MFCGGAEFADDMPTPEEFARLRVCDAVAAIEKAHYRAHQRRRHRARAGDCAGMRTCGLRYRARI